MVHIEAHHVRNLGDHGREVVTVFESIEGETVEELVARVGAEVGPFAMQQPRRLDPEDFIVLRRVIPAPES